jgi:uncharacterized protein YndB with AHSA1/START domain
MKLGATTATLLALLPFAAGAEVRIATPDALLVRHAFQIAAPAAKAWDTLVHPERYWPSDHTWSGTRESLSLEAAAGGCFCERWEGGSAQHGVVVMAVPGEALKIEAALGPFLDMAISGMLAIELAETGGATTAVVTYRVSGDSQHALDKLASKVDEVIKLQFSGFAELAAQKSD